MAEVTVQDLPSSEASPELFDRVTDQVTTEGNSLMVENNDVGGKDPKEFHTSEHPKTMQVRKEGVSDAFNLSGQQRKIIGMAIAWHDTIIEVDTPDPENAVGMISRHRGAREGDQPGGEEGNEAESARQMKEAIQQANQEAGQEVISDTQAETAFFAIEATYPAVNFGDDFQGATFTDYPYYQQVIAQNPNIRVVLDRLEQKEITKATLFFQPHLEESLERGELVPEEVITTALNRSDELNRGYEQIKQKDGEKEAFTYLAKQMGYTLKKEPVF